ncbi:acyl-CoA dehydrogenase family protein [Streptomyces sp. DH8]|uniref:acyl-CoA dehydrogenase family protein n=1 Tax=Streptomyces sp. DH8 TaxID=2857008 RepID=UPI0035B3BA3F
MRSSSLAAQRLGSAARAAGAAVQHAREPEQFGSSFGPFRVVEHPCVGISARTGPARAAVYGAAVTGDRAGIAAAAPPAGGAAVRRTRHRTRATAPDSRGTGFTWEADVHLRLERSRLRAADGVAGGRGGGGVGSRPGGRAPGFRQLGGVPAGEGPSRGRSVTQRIRPVPTRVCGPCGVGHRAESGPASGTLRGMRVVLEPGDPGAACAAAPVPGEGSRRRCAGPARRAFPAVSARSCSTPRNVRRTVCTTRTPSRWNMPEALVAVTVRQPCCRVRESRSVTLRRREAMCPPVRMV